MKRITLVSIGIAALVLTITALPAAAGPLDDDQIDSEEGAEDGIGGALMDAIDFDDDSQDSDAEDTAEETVGGWLLDTLPA